MDQGNVVWSTICIKTDLIDPSKDNNTNSLRGTWNPERGPETKFPGFTCTWNWRRRSHCARYDVGPAIQEYKCYCMPTVFSLRKDSAMLVNLIRKCYELWFNRSHKLAIITYKIEIIAFIIDRKPHRQKLKQHIFATEMICRTYSKPQKSMKDDQIRVTQSSWKSSILFVPIFKLQSTQTTFLVRPCTDKIN